jgi:hypothetical protein
MRKGKARADGSKPWILDSQCKECRRQQQAARHEERMRTDPEYQDQLRRWRKASRKNAQRERLRARRESDRQLPIGPFQGWLRENINGTPVQELAKNVGVDEALFRRTLSGEKSRVTMSVVDRTGLVLNHPGLLTELYPSEVE